MKIVERTVKLWAYLSMILCVAIIIFLFAFVFIKGGAILSLEFLFSST